MKGLKTLLVQLFAPSKWASQMWMTREEVVFGAVKDAGTWSIEKQGFVVEVNWLEPPRLGERRRGGERGGKGDGEGMQPMVDMKDKNWPFRLVRKGGSEFVSNSLFVGRVGPV